MLICFIQITYTVCVYICLFLPSLISLQFFHFSSRAFPPLDGQFTGRIRWQGSPARGDASISLINSTLNDNGTYTCSVRNPPDVHGSPTSQTVLTVTPKGKLGHIHICKCNQAGHISSCSVFFVFKSASTCTFLQLLQLGAQSSCPIWTLMTPSRCIYSNV